MNGPLNSFKTKLHYSTVSKISLIQAMKLGALKVGCFEMPQLQMLHLQLAVFQIDVIIASGHSFSRVNPRMFSEAKKWTF